MVKSFPRIALMAPEWQGFSGNRPAGARHQESVAGIQVILASVDHFRTLSGIIGKHNFVILED